MITVQDIHWMAGFLEGEGSFTVARQKRLSFLPKISAVSTDRDNVEIVAQFFGTTVNGPYKYGDNKKPWWSTAVSGARAIGWMMTLYALMSGRRKAKIREILKEWKERDSKTGPKKKIT